MPALKPTDYFGEITWIGAVMDRDQSLRSQSMSEAMLDWDGIAGEAHGGINRPSCSRVAALYTRGTDIRNTRQLTILSQEELARVAEKMGVDQFNPAWAGASLILKGIPDFTHLPPSSRLQAASGATLVIDMENRPCNLPVPVIEEDAPGKGRAFRTASNGHRGVTAWVERPGKITLGEPMRLFVPDQRAWDYLAEARGTS